MAINIDFTADGCSVVAYHDNPEAQVMPAYEARFTLTSDFKLSVTIKDSEQAGAWFQFNVGYLAVGANNVVHTDKKLLGFGTNINTGTYYGPRGNSVSFSDDLSDLTFPIAFTFICAGCDYQITGGTDMVEWVDSSGMFIINDARKPDPPTIVSTTGTTITVSNGTDGLYCNTNKDGWYNTPHTFTGLAQGKSYEFISRLYYNNNTQYSTSDPITGKTWSISGSVSTSLTSLTFTATHIAGTNGDATKTITYYLYTSKSTSSTLIDLRASANGGSVTFSGLDPNKTYYCYICTTGIPDNDTWVSGKTKIPASVTNNTGNVSATTLRASVSWSVGDAKSITCVISCNGSSRTLSSSGSYVGFTGLTPGSTYTVSWTITYVVYNEITKKDDTFESTGSFSLTTKKATLTINENTDITSKIIRFSSSCNTSDSMEHKMSPGDDWHVPDQMPEVYNNLTHNSQYTIYCRISGCFAFNTSGSQTNVNDSEISKTVKTKTLSFLGSISEEHQHSLVTLWQAQVDGVNTDRDAIDGTQFRFTYMDTMARKSNPPYQAAEVIEGSNGNTTGDYQSNKKIYSNNLTWYYCAYVVSASITDGHNIVGAAVIAHTIFPAKWIFSGGQWHRYMPHVYTNGNYVPAPEFVYSNNTFREPNGE